MMKVGILISSISHYECIGFICDILDQEYNITIYHKTDIHNFLGYFSNLYKFNNKNIDDFINDDNDILIKLSETDTISQYTENLLNKTIIILHNNNNSIKYRNTISLSPFLSNGNIGINFLNMIPVYKNINININNYENIILYIGLIETYYFTEDFIDLIKSSVK